MNKKKDIDILSSSEGPSGRWWFSADGKRGFRWASVRGFTYRQGELSPALYLYLEAGIYHLTGIEAEQVHKVLVKKVERHNDKDGESSSD